MKSDDENVMAMTARIRSAVPCCSNLSWTPRTDAAHLTTDLVTGDTANTAGDPPGDPGDQGTRLTRADIRHRKL